MRMPEDLRSALRSLRSSPTFTTVALVVLALGIGAGTAIFSVVDAVVLRGLPFDEHDRLVAVLEHDITRATTFGGGSTTTQTYLDWRRLQTSFAGLAATGGTRFRIRAADGEPAEARAQRVTAEFFDVVRVAPLVGRAFTEDDEIEGRQRVAILGYGFWQRRFGGAPDVVGRTIDVPIPRMSYQEAMARYGSDKPDLRVGMAIEDLSAVFAESGFGVFRDAVAGGGAVRGIAIPGGAAASRREIDQLGAQAKALGAGGLAWARAAEGAVQSSILKTAGEETVRAALAAAGAGPADLLVMVAGEPTAISKVLGQIRLSVARQKGLLDPEDLAFTWVVEFPLFEWDDREGRHVSMHHPFTSPREEDLDRLESAPGEVRARAYDLVLNGSEIGGGSIRIHDPALQARIFRLLNIGDADARARFGFFLEALEYGTPPHGGIALGLDRITSILAGEVPIRDVIAFPKTTAAVDLMAGSPSPVDARQLEELHIRAAVKPVPDGSR